MTQTSAVTRWASSWHLSELHLLGLVIGGLLLIAGVFLWACIRLAAVDAEKGR